MTTQDVANKLVELCRKEGDEYMKAYDLYADDCVSIERPFGGEETRIEGKEAILKMTAEWMENAGTITKSELSDPVVSEMHFALSWFMETQKEGEEPKGGSELAVYHVKDGKIVQCEFLYPPMK